VKLNFDHTKKLWCGFAAPLVDFTRLAVFDSTLLIFVAKCFL